MPKLFVPSTSLVMVSRLLALVLGFVAPVSITLASPIDLWLPDRVPGTLATTDAFEEDEKYYDEFTVWVNANTRLAIEMTSDTFDTYLIVTLPTGAEAINDDFGGSTSISQVVVESPIAGEIHIRATSFAGNTTGRYWLSLERSGESLTPVEERVADTLAARMRNSGRTPVRLSRFSTEEGSLTSSDAVHNDRYIDHFIYSPTQRERVVFDLTADYDCYLRVENVDGTGLLENDDFETTRASRIITNVRPGTDLIVEVSSFGANATGSYTLNVRPESGAAQALTLGTLTEGNLTADDRIQEGRGYADDFRLYGRAGETITVRLESPDYDCYLMVTMPDGRTELNDDFDGNTRISQLTLTFNQTGEALVMSTSFSSNTTGRYTLIATSGSAPVTLRADIPVSGNLSTTDEQDPATSKYRDSFTYRGNAGEQVVIDLTSDTYDTYLQITGPDGATDLNDDFGSTRRSQLTYTFPTSGDLAIVVTSFSGNTTGEYTIVVQPQRTTPVATAIDVRVGQTLRGEISESDPTDADGKYRDEYRIYGNAGQTITVTMNADDFDNYLDAYLPDGTRVFNDDFGSTRISQISLTFSSAGYATIYATTFGTGTTGTYAIAFEDNVVVSDATELFLNRTVNGTLAPGDNTYNDGKYYDEFRLYGRAGESYRVTMNASDFDNYLDAWQTDQTNVFNDDFGSTRISQIELNFPQSGYATIYATSFSVNSTGSYSVTVESMGGGNGQPLGLNSTTSGTWDSGDQTEPNRGYADSYQLTGRPGMNVRVRIESPSVDTYLIVRMPDGRELTNDDFDGLSVSQLDLTFNQGGTATVIATTFSSGLTGPYTLTTSVR